VFPITDHLKKVTVINVNKKMKKKTHKDLEVWKIAIDLVTDIYNVTKSFPKGEIYGLTNQIRRSAVSIPSNIAEGSARNSTKENIQFLYISLGSVSELETQLIIAENINYINQVENEELQSKIKHIRKMLIDLINFYKRKTE